MLKLIVLVAFTASFAHAQQCPDNDADYKGGDLKLNLDVPSWWACGEGCQKEAGCTGFTYVPKTKCCYLKSGDAKSNRVAAPGLISGDKTCPACQQQTEGGNANGACCVFPFTYGGKTYDSCIGTNNGGKLWCATTANYDTDKKWGNCNEECPMMGISMPGFDITGKNGKDFGASSWQECADKCAAQAKCKYWTFTASRKWCYLKTSDGGKKKNPFGISGPKSCGRSGVSL